MKLTNLRDDTITWRVFNWDDPWALNNDPLRADKAHGDVPSLSSFAYNDGAGQFLLEIQDKASRKTIYWPSLHFNREVSVVDSEGRVRAFVNKHLEIAAPVDNEILTQTRLGLGVDWASVILRMGDSGKLEDKHNHTQLYIFVQQPGRTDRLIRLSTDSWEDEWPDTLTFPRTNLDLRHSGPTRLIAKLGSPPNFELSSLPVDITVAPTAPRDYEISMNGQPGPSPTIDAPLSGTSIHVEFWGDAAGAYYDVRIQTSLDGFASISRGKSVGIPVRNGKLTTQFEAWIPVHRDHAPGQHQLKLIDKDFFDVLTETIFNFATTDTTAPDIEISAPQDRTIFWMNEVSEQKPYTVTVSGKVVDRQSGYLDGSLTYSFSGATSVVPVDPGSGRWTFNLSVTTYGSFTVSIFATDKAGNTNLQPKQIRFEIQSSFKPRSIEDLLSPRAYLQELLRFSQSHIVVKTASGQSPSPITPMMLNAAFQQDFGGLTQPDFPAATEIRNDLLMPVRLLRSAQAQGQSAGLIARYSFDEAQNRTDDVLLDRGGRYGLNGRYIGGVAVDATLRGAIPVDANHYAVVESSPLLEVGKNNSDFSVSFWMYIKDRPSGWVPVITKHTLEVNTDRSTWNRTFAIWLHPESNHLHCRIGTSTNANDGGDSNAEIAIGRWTHVAYVKSGNTLRIFFDGRIDQEVRELAPVISNAAQLNIGRDINGTPGFTGAFDELRIYAVALSTEDVAALALDRRSRLTETPVTDYHRAAYEALLMGLGTSSEELRLLRLMNSVNRAALAERLGLSFAPEQGDNLESLLPDFNNVHPGTDQYESWLKITFGLPYSTDVNIADVETLPGVIATQLSLLCWRWGLEDATRIVPDLDPDLLEVTDLSPGANAWISALRLREVELAEQHQHFVATLSKTDGTAQGAVTEVFTLEEQAQLLDLGNQEAGGSDISGDLANLKVDRLLFRRLIGYLKLFPSSLSIREVDDLAHLLVQEWKKRFRYSVWRSEEGVMGPQRLWPFYSTRLLNPASGAWVPGNFRSSFWPWRGNSQARTDLSSRLTARLNAWQSVLATHAQAIAAAQRHALPILRDGLLGLSDLPGDVQRMNALTQRWLMDFAASGATELTPIEQATSSLQILINGVRGGWFDEGHPSHNWVVVDDASNPFDLRWHFIESYGRWQAAVLNYLYPENVLYPELLENPGSYLENLPDELAKLPNLATGFRDKLDRVPLDERSAEEHYFGHITIGLALQRAGNYSLALDVYRKVYDTSKRSGRRLAYKLNQEPENGPPVVVFTDPNWTSNLISPHRVALNKSGSQNPYTRFTLFQILQCILAHADDAFASGSRDGRVTALALYLEANDILSFPELQDLQPVDLRTQAYLPSPVLSSLRAHTASALSKLRRGLSYLGTPMPPDLTRSPGGGAVSSLVRPTPYRYRVLMERAKQLIAQSQQLEAQYLSALERGDSETEKLLTSGFAVDNAQQTVSLRLLQETEASHGLDLATRQQARSQTQEDRYRDWLAAGPTANERAQTENLWAAKTARDAIAVFDATVTGLQAFGGAADLISIVSSGGAKLANAASIALAAAGRGVAQGFLNDNDTRAQVSGIQAAQERRTQEWALQRDLANHDVAIGAAQMTLAQDRIEIAAHESLMANTQLSQAKQMLAFLSDKFSSARFYQWFAGELGQIYATFLRLATVTGQHAELQLAFERQEQPARLIKADYWQLAAQSAAASSGSTGTSQGSTPLDPKGITGSARLLQDLYTLDEHAFSSERRLLNLSQGFSLARLMPIEFEEFRRTGLLAFATPMRWFDEGFPGHYMRLIKRVRISVAALIPPSIGIRATLANGGLSRVVTADSGMPTVVIRQDPQLVALTSPMASTGVFELDTQGDLLYPFEGTGVDTTWYLELPPAGNPFDFDSLIDVVLSIDYTAQFSPELRDRVVKTLPRQSMGDRSFSIKRDLPDTWYEIANGSGDAVNLTLPVSRLNFPPGLTDVRVSELALSARTTSGVPCAFVATLTITTPGGSPRVGATVQSIRGIASSRQTGGAGWHSRQVEVGQTLDVIDNLPPLGDGPTHWAFAVGNQPTPSVGDETTFLQQLRAGTVDDILVVMTFSGQRPAWG